MVKEVGIELMFTKHIQVNVVTFGTHENRPPVDLTRPGGETSKVSVGMGWVREHLTDEDIPRIKWDERRGQSFYKLSMAVGKLYKEGVLERDEARELIGFEESEENVEDILRKPVEKKSPVEEKLDEEKKV